MGIINHHNLITTLLTPNLLPPLNLPPIFGFACGIVGDNHPSDQRSSSFAPGLPSHHFTIFFVLHAIGFFVAIQVFSLFVRGSFFRVLFVVRSAW